MPQNYWMQCTNCSSILQVRNSEVSINCTQYLQILVCHLHDNAIHKMSFAWFYLIAVLSGHAMSHWRTVTAAWEYRWCTKLHWKELFFIMKSLMWYGSVADAVLLRSALHQVRSCSLASNGNLDHFVVSSLWMLIYVKENLYLFIQRPKLT